MFGQDWTKAEATIVARDSNFTGDGMVAVHTFVADVRMPGEAVLRATVKEPTIATDFWPPSIGDVVSVLVRSKDQKVKFDKDDDRLSAKAYRARQTQAFDAVRQQPPAASYGDSVPSLPSELPDAVASTLAQLGITPTSHTQVFSADPAQAEAMLAAFARLGGQAGGQAGGQGSEAPPTIESRLARLDSLRQHDLLTVEEYDEQRKRILDEV